MTKKNADVTFFFGRCVVVVVSSNFTYRNDADRKMLKGPLP